MIAVLDYIYVDVSVYVLQLLQEAHWTTSALCKMLTIDSE